MWRINRTGVKAGFLFIILFGMVGALYAGGAFDVVPVTVELSVNKPIQAITITNHLSRPMTFQTIALQRFEKLGRVTYKKTNDFIVVPPVFKVLPNQKQIIRVTYRGRPPAEELLYRLTFQELLEPRDKAKPHTIQFSYNLHLPVYVEPVKSIRTLQWQLTPLVNAKSHLVVDNTGNERVKISRVVVKTSKQVLFDEAVSEKILAHHQKDWTIDLSNQQTLLAELPEKVFLEAETNWGKMKQVLVLTTHLQ